MKKHSAPQYTLRRQSGSLNSVINVDLWPPQWWGSAELSDMIDLMKHVAPTSGQISHDTRGLELQIAISFAAGALAASFLNNLSTDLYEGAKSQLKTILLKRGNRSSPAPPGELIGRLTFSYHDDDMGRFDTYGFYCEYRSPNDLESFFASVAAINTVLHEGRALRAFPFDKGDRFDVDAELQIDQGRSWEIRIRRYTEGTGGRLTLNEFFFAYTSVNQGGGAKWSGLQWGDRIRKVVGSP